jgi:hypothetical protein
LRHLGALTRALASYAPHDAGDARARVCAIARASLGRASSIGQTRDASECPARAVP